MENDEGERQRGSKGRPPVVLSHGNGSQKRVDLDEAALYERGVASARL